MKSYFLSILLILFSLSVIAQSNKEKLYSHEISFDFGLFASLNTHQYENLVGNKYSLQMAYIYHTRFGVRSGISLINDLEGTNKFYQIPIHLLYRTSVNKTFYIGGTIDSLEELLFKIILGLVPRQADYHMGINLGYNQPDNRLSTTNDNHLVKAGYYSERRFVTTIDAGIRLNYKIKRISIVAAPYVSYLITENFKYFSFSGINQGYQPKWFMNVSIGLSYRF